MNQTHSKKFHCTYLLHYYPFDAQVRNKFKGSNLSKRMNNLCVIYTLQVCHVDFQLKQFDKDSVKLEPGGITMLSPIELTQYYIKVKLV